MEKSEKHPLNLNDDERVSHDQETKCPPFRKIIYYIILWGVGIMLIIFTMGIGSHILATGPKWRQRLVQGITDQNTYCFGKDTLNTYGSLLLVPSICQMAILFFSCCCGKCFSEVLIFIMGLLTSTVTLADGIAFLKLANENRIISTTQCPSHYKGRAVRVDGFFLTPMAILMIICSVLYSMVIVRSMWKKRSECEAKCGDSSYVLV